MTALAGRVDDRLAGCVYGCVDRGGAAGENTHAGYTNRSRPTHRHAETHTSTPADNTHTQGGTHSWSV